MFFTRYIVEIFYKVFSPPLPYLLLLSLFLESNLPRKWIHDSDESWEISMLSTCEMLLQGDPAGRDTEGCCV